MIQFTNFFVRHVIDMLPNGQWNVSAFGGTTHAFNVVAYNDGFQVPRPVTGRRGGVFYEFVTGEVARDNNLVAHWTTDATKYDGVTLDDPIFRGERF